MPMMWHGYCPLSTVCSKGNRQLCCKVDRDAAVRVVASHLHNSSYHYMAAADSEDIITSTM